MYTFKKTKTAKKELYTFISQKLNLRIYIKS